MPKIDIDKLVEAMVKAAVGELKGNWPRIKDYALPEFTKLATVALDIQQSKDQGQIDEDTARDLIKMQKNALESVKQTVDAKLAAATEQAINAAINVARGIINTAIGWAIL